MCGIAGYVDFEGETDPKVLGRMTDSIAYRGPDSSGKYFNKNKSVGLGIRRLSIIDLATGDQPIKNEDGNVVVVYNGEIYGYKNLRDDLIKNGHKLKTKSDTETLVHLYEQYGEKMAGMLNGMFSFVIWDEKNQKLFIAKDRYGIKPLYYTVVGKKLIFGSEPKSILSNSGFKKAVSDEGLSSYFYLGYTLGEKSIYRNIFKLLPGHYLTFDKWGLKVQSYFELGQNKELENANLDSLLEKSVQTQLISDVPVGVFLSGGLDSSLIAYYISKFKKLKSFSIGFKEEGYDESFHAHYVAKKIGTEHYSEEYSPEDVIDSFNQITSRLDEPFADASLFPTFKVSKLARQYVKVVLSGDGGDELFGGYPTYQAHLFKNYVDKLYFLNGDTLLSFLNFTPDFLLNLLPVSFKDYPKKKLAKIVLNGLKIKDSDQRHFYWMRTFFLGEERIYQKDHNKSELKLSLSYKLDDTHINVGQLIDFHSYLPDDFFFKVDRASMYNSLEVRVPFMDNNVVDYAFSTKKTHLNLLKTKIQLRSLLKEKLPEIAKRPKKGFGIPLEIWLKGDLKELGKAAISNEKMYEYVNEKKIKKLWDDHQSGEKNNSGNLWLLIMFSGWLKNWS